MMAKVKALDVNAWVSQTVGGASDIVSQVLGGSSRADADISIAEAMYDAQTEQARYAAEAAGDIAQAQALASLYGGAVQETRDQSARQAATTKEQSADSTRTLLWIGGGAAVVLIAIILVRK